MDLLQSAKTLVILLLSLLTAVLSFNDSSNATIWIRKCCDVNNLIKEDFYVFENSTNLIIPVYKNVNESKSSATVLYAYNFTVCTNQGIKKLYPQLQPDVFPGQAYFVQNDGKLWVPVNNTTFDYDQHCIDYGEDDGISVELMNDGVTLELNKIGIVISLPFLLVTFIVYALLPEQNLHGKCLMSYVFALFWAFFLAILLHDLHISETDILIVCKVMGKLIYFFIMSSFFWMNAIPFDMWLTFSGTKSFSIENRQPDEKRFLKYSGYAWGMALLFVILHIFLTYAGSPNAWYNPGEKCWFNGVVPQILFYYGPLVLLITINIILFSLTSWKIKPDKKEEALLRSSRISNRGYQNDDIQRFYLYLKLVFAMGINWSMEVIPWIIYTIGGNVPLWVWYFGEFCNAAFGAFIFFIFVFKKSKWTSLKKRYFKMKGKS